MKQIPNPDLISKDSEEILALRLLIARAANKDSLAWWDDESLTPAAGYLLERLFPMAPDVAARKLALTAAEARHRTALVEHPGALHLYDLDADHRDRLALRFQPLRPVPLTAGPITTMVELREQLAGLVDRPAYQPVRQTASGGLQIEIRCPPGTACSLVDRARALAWAYLEGTPGQPVFPFILESSLD